MKKSIFIIFCLLGFISLTGCTSAMLTSMLGPQTGYGFTSSSSNPAYGYEKFAWGTSYETLKEKTGWSISGKNGTYFVGIYSKGWGANNYYEDYYPHGGRDLYVDKTVFHFREEGAYDAGRYKRTSSQLYAAEDEFKKTPSMDFLHKRYGQFSEENLVTSYQKSEGIETVYRGQDYLSVGNFYALEIFIYADGKTIVKLQDPLMKKSMSEAAYASAPNEWFCYAALDAPNKRINFTFLHQNKDGKYLFIGYSKGYESANISYVRSGICWGKDANGSYDIKGDSGVVSKNYSTEKWKCAFNGVEYAYTSITGESARDILGLFLASEKISVRHNNAIAEFESSGKQLRDKMAEYGITWEELDSALLNEEF